MAQTGGAQGVSYANNPSVGTVLLAAAGGQAEAEFDFTNDSPDPAGFHLEVEGLPGDWVSGVGTAYEAMAAASGGGSLRLTITPPVNAPGGEYDFRVRIVSGGGAIGPDHLALVLRVEPGAGSNGTDVGTQPTATAVVQTLPPEIVKTQEEPAQTEQPVTRRTRDLPQKAAPEVEATTAFAPPQSEPQQKRESETPPVTATVTPIPSVARQPEQQPVETTQPPVTAREITPATPTPRETVTPRETTPQPHETVAQTPQPTPTRRIQPEPESEPVLVDIEPTHPLEHEDVGDDSEPPPIVEPSILDPKDGTVLSLRPGETLLVRFSFTNTTPRDRTYVLDEDRSLEDGWLTLVQDQVNLTKNGRGEVFFRLNPPVDATPGDYPFTVSLGPQGQVLNPCSLTLSVMATPAVKIATKANTVKFGPFGRVAEFQLAVESAGNSDTAFRIGVKAPVTEGDGTQASRGPEYIYDSNVWRFLFDKELETLRAPAVGRTPQPVPIRLRLFRKGIWWFGLRETQKVSVAAIPVTEPTNGGKTGNVVDLTAVRWRILPFPAQVLVPLFLLFLLFLSGGVNDVSLSEGKYAYKLTTENGTTDNYWVVAPVDKDTKESELAWQARVLCLYKVTGGPTATDTTAKDSKAANVALNKTVLGSGSLPITGAVSPSRPEAVYNYRVSRWIGGADKDIQVHYIYTRKGTHLEAKDVSEKNPKNWKNKDSAEFELNVPAKGSAKIDLANLAQDNNDITWWMVKKPDDKSAFVFDYQKANGLLKPLGNDKINREKLAEHLKIKMRDASSLKERTEDEIVLVTTDADRPVIKIKLVYDPTQVAP